MEWQKILAIIGDRYLQHSYLTSDILMTAALRFSVLPTVCEGHKCINEKCTNLLWKSQLKLGVESNWNSFEICSIRKFAIQLIRKGKKYSKNSMKINSKFVLFNLTPTIGWSQIFQMLDLLKIRSMRFENLSFD